MKRLKGICILVSLFFCTMHTSHAFWGFGKTSTAEKKEKKEEPSAWDKLVSDAKNTLKEYESDPGNADTPTWENLKVSANEAMQQFAKDGKGFDIMEHARKQKKKLVRKIERIAADENSVLTGRFFDLKQPVDNSARPLYREDVVNYIREFMENDWDQEMLEKYYSPKVKLAAPYFYLPRCKASYAPKAFECNGEGEERKVEPQNWVVVYSGQVTAPESGTYRFVGMGDDAIVVRFNKEVVLESGWSIPSRNSMTLGIRPPYQKEITRKEPGYALYQYRETPHWNHELGGIASGATFEVEEGESYPIEILLSEIPGNEFGFCLLIEKIEQSPAPYGRFAPGKSPILALFRTNDTTPDMEEIEEKLTENGEDYTVSRPLEAPPFAEDSPIWIATPTHETEERNVVERTAATLSDEDTAMGRRVETTDETGKPAEDPRKILKKTPSARQKRPSKTNKK